MHTVQFLGFVLFCVFLLKAGGGCSRVFLGVSSVVNTAL